MDIPDRVQRAAELLGAWIGCDVRLRTDAGYCNRERRSVYFYHKPGLIGEDLSVEARGGFAQSSVTLVRWPNGDGNIAEWPALPDEERAE